jgi:hypothetical protein
VTGYLATLHGTGSVEIPAFGVADAEARLEKELHRAAPDAIIRIDEIRRAENTPRIVETFAVTFRLVLAIQLDIDDAGSAERAAFAAVRARLRGTRFARVAWEKVVIAKR